MILPIVSLYKLTMLYKASDTKPDFNMATLIALLVPVPSTSLYRQCHVVDFLFIVTPIVRVCNCSMFCCILLYVPSSFAIILMGKRESWLLCFVRLYGVS